nr:MULTISPECIES: hypothetical protein [Treponema]
MQSSNPYFLSRPQRFGKSLSLIPKSMTDYLSMPRCP